MASFLRDARIQALQVDFAHADFLFEKARGVCVDAELFEGNEWRGAVGLVDSEIIDGDGERERAEFHVFDFHLAADEFFGVGDHIVFGNAGSEF